VQRPDDEPPVGAKSAVSARFRRDQLIGVMTLVHPKPSDQPGALALVRRSAIKPGLPSSTLAYMRESQRQARVMTALLKRGGNYRHVETE
jgi:hypothetical protein